MFYGIKDFGRRLFETRCKERRGQMKNWLPGTFYLFAILLGLLVFTGAVEFETTDPSADEDPSHGVICERSEDTAPGCAPPAEGVGRVLDALLSCDTAFFKVLNEEKAFFGHVKIRQLPHDEENTDDPIITIIDLAEPVVAHGLHLTRYRQEMHFSRGGWPTAYVWGFQAIEEPKDVLRAILARHPSGTKFFGGGGTWFRDDEQALHRKFTIAAAREAGFPGTHVECHVARQVMRSTEEPPEASQLFLSSAQ